MYNNTDFNSTNFFSAVLFIYTVYCIVYSWRSFNSFAERAWGIFSNNAWREVKLGGGGGGGLGLISNPSLRVSLSTARAGLAGAQSSKFYSTANQQRGSVTSF